jgi:CBS-domain-containing membrane protein
MSHLCSNVVRCWGTRPSLRLSGHLWVVAMFAVLAVLEANRIGVFLVPPFGATLTILMLLPDTPVAQPYALIVGSVCGAVGTGASFLGNGIGIAVLAMIAAFVVTSLIQAYHPQESPSHRFQYCFTRVIGFLCWSCFPSPSQP